MVISVQKAFGCEVSKILNLVRINYEKSTWNWNVISAKKIIIAP